MNNTMMSILKHFEANYAAIGLASPDYLKTIGKSRTTIADGEKWLVVLALRTIPDLTRGLSFNNLVASGVKAVRFMTTLELECRTRASDPSADFYWNDARAFRDQVYAYLAGPSQGGLVIPRYDYTDPANPVQAGEIWFQVDPRQNSPLEDEIEDQNDPANKSVFLTYKISWWKPV